MVAETVKAKQEIKHLEVYKFINIVFTSKHLILMKWKKEIFNFSLKYSPFKLPNLQTCS